jgi:hypothetical protein
VPCPRDATRGPRRSLAVHGPRDPLTRPPLGHDRSGSVRVRTRGGAGRRGSA